MHCNVDVRVCRRRCGCVSATLGEDLGFGINDDEQTAACEGAELNEGSTTEFCLRGIHRSPLCFLSAIGGDMNGFADSDVGSASAHVSGHRRIDLGVTWFRSFRE